jgi:hypothetical protein
MENSDKYSKWKWLSKPTTIDTTYSKVGESVVSWLGRSTTKRAQIFRQFLKRNLDEIPSEYQEHFIKALQTRWDSAFLEFILARTIQVLGGKFFIELKNSDGKCPDFLVSFGDHQLIIEVVSPKFDSEGDEERTRDKPLIKFINANMPTGWSVSVVQLPNIGYEDPQKEFKRTFLQMCAELPDKPHEEFVYKSKKLKSGLLHLGFFPQEQVNGSRWYSIESPKDTEDIIKYAAKRKRKQVRSESLPVLLAIHGSGYGVKFDDFDRALFGYKTIVENTRNNLQEAVIKPDGIFLESGKEDKTPTFAGILAFKRVDLSRHPDPVIYHHPRFFGELPEEIMIFEQRRLRDSAINIQPPKRKNVLAELGFISDD